MAKKQDDAAPAALEFTDPGQQKLTKVSAARLAAISGIQAEQFIGATVAEIGAKYGHLIDPKLLFFRRVCGKVVKTDPGTGVDYPVPFANVYVEDTDVSVLTYFPGGSPWTWHFPFNYRREVIAQTTTDACGQFCVWIPRWDIDWVLRWRFERTCYPVVFERPNLGDIIKRVFPERWPLPIPRPGDPEHTDLGPILPGVGPEPIARLDVSRAVFEQRLTDAVGAPAARAVLAADPGTAFGGSTEGLEAALAAPAFAAPLAPPLGADVKAALVDHELAAKNIDGAGVALANVAATLRVAPGTLDGVDLRQYIGPFKRCYDRIVPEWVPIFDVPDITFRVTQDVNGDGTEFPIYDEGLFQVRWDAGNLPPVTLHAGPQAIAGLECGPSNVPCGDQPAIVLAGWLPVDDPSIFDATHGVSIRTNRPHASGQFTELPPPLIPLPAAAPLAGALTLFGCNRTDPAATKYRIVYEYAATDGAPFSAPTPFLGITWDLRREVGGTPQTLPVIPDGNGWYPILGSEAVPWLQEDVLLNWVTPNYPDGLYRLTVELDSGAPSAPVTFAIDNSAPSAHLGVAWSFTESPDSSYQPLGAICPVVHRGSALVDLYFRVTLDASSAHLRSTLLGGSGCGNGEFQFLSGQGGVRPVVLPGTSYELWHETVADTTANLVAYYKLPAGAQEGTYSFEGDVASRAFNPQGADGEQNAGNDWEYEPEYIYTRPYFPFSVVNE